MRRDLAIVPEGTTEDKLIELWVRLKKSEHTQRAYRHDIAMFRDVVEKPLVEVTLEDALDFCDSLDELEITNKRGERKPLEDNSRVSELYNLRWRHVIRRSNGVQLDIMSGKGDKQRHVLLPERSWDILSAIREGAADTDFVFRSRQEVSRAGYYKGTRLDATTIFRIVREAAKRAGVPNWYEVSPHWLRHCHGSHAIDHQAPLTVVRDTLGHSNIAVTNEYAKARPDQSSSGYLPLS